MVYAFLFLIGAALGSFVNVLATRYQPGGSIFGHGTVRGRSKCPKCEKILAWYELIPVVSFLIQWRRCRNCSSYIAWRYLLMELVGGLIMVMTFLYFGLFPISIFWTAILFVLLLITLIDLRHYVIPDQLNLALVLGGAALIGVSGISDWAVWKDHLLGAAIGLVIFSLIVLLTKGRGMGLGDLKLAGALGFLFGWQGILVILMGAFIFGGLAATGILLSGKRGWKDALPFGPFLATASMLYLFCGHVIIDKYF
ncbi:MAG: leader peptidase (prepilin peptidase) / N-methyltransferase [Parcubacteria group bacterium Gr01-1014_3]|nr:MAG: leader peptidase (prepilin peptidase) / N-methyltransferase [Parcubacteria group bacterium Gr01-1014_3]